MPTVWWVGIVAQLWRKSNNSKFPVCSQGQRKMPPEPQQSRAKLCSLIELPHCSLESQPRHCCKELRANSSPENNHLSVQKCTHHHPSRERNNYKTMQAFSYLLSKIPTSSFCSVPGKVSELIYTLPAKNLQWVLSKMYKKLEQ